jgi:protein-disulfide isomerase
MVKRKFSRRMKIVFGWLFCLLLQPSLAASQSKAPSAVPNGSVPILGSPSAPVTIIEFSDFQCGFCKRFWVETLPKLKEAYINRGKTRFIYRHFAILGKHSEQAAEAAECAAEQRKFWEYQDQLFLNQGPLAFTVAKLEKYAGELRLNGEAFANCLRTGKYKGKVERETEAAVYLGGGGYPSLSSTNAYW